jgi:hypothetical protein
MCSPLGLVWHDRSSGWGEEDSASRVLSKTAALGAAGLCTIGVGVVAVAEAVATMVAVDIADTSTVVGKTVNIGSKVAKLAGKMIGKTAKATWDMANGHTQQTGVAAVSRTRPRHPRVMSAQLKKALKSFCGWARRGLE